MTPTATTATRDIAYQLHPFTNLRKHESEGPLVITGGRGIYVQDESGRESGWSEPAAFGETMGADGHEPCRTREIHGDPIGGPAGAAVMEGTPGPTAGRRPARDGLDRQKAK